MNGKDTIVHDNDVVSIIPVIHGGLSKKLIFEIEKKQNSNNRNWWSKKN